MTFKRRTYLATLIALSPCACMAQGIEQGINDFLFVSLGVVVPSFALLILFYYIAVKSKTRFAPLVYMLSLYLGVICIKTLARYIYLYNLRSDNIRIDGSGPDMSNELAMILGCTVGLLAAIAIVFTTVKKSRRQ